MQEKKTSIKNLWKVKSPREMSANGSSPSSFNSSSSSSSLTDICYTSTASTSNIIGWSCTYILFFLPLAIYIVYLGLQRRHRQGSVSTAVAVTCNLDLFTYNVIAMKMIIILGHFVATWATFIGFIEMIFTMSDLITAVSIGESWFHVLTCVERYLAVVHPITYLSMRSTTGMRIRNLSIGSAWFLSVVWIWITLLYRTLPRITYSSILVIAVIITSFCSFFVLRNLTHPGPGEGRGAREQVNKGKKRAFHTILVITGVLSMRFVGSLLYILVDGREEVDPWIQCALVISGIWATLPSSYVLPLLFLHRAGKLLCCKSNTV